MTLLRPVLACLLLLLFACAGAQAMDLRPYAKADAVLASADTVLRQKVWHALTVEAYQTVGSKDPRFDDDMVRLLEGTNTYLFSGSTGQPVDRAALLALARTLSAKDASADPLALWAVYLLSDGDWRAKNAACDRLRRAFVDDARAQPGGAPRYAYLLRIDACNHVLGTWGRAEKPEDHARAVKLAQTLAENVAAFITRREYGQAPSVLIKTIALIDLNHQDFGEPVVKAVDAALDEAKVEPWLAATVKAVIRKSNAWAWRGSGWASSVTEEGWAGFNRNLKEAEGFINEAWRLNPTEPRICDIGITLANTVETSVPAKEWFRRGVSTCFDQMELYATARQFQRPRWGGSYEAMILLGCDCVDTGRFDTKVPMNLVDCLGDAISEATQMKGLDALMPVLALERVDQAVQACIAGYVAKQPERVDEFRMIRTAHLWYAGRRDEARAELERIPEAARSARIAKRFRLDLPAILGKPAVEATPAPAKPGDF